MSDKASDGVTLNRLVADLEEIDSRLVALIAANPSGDETGQNAAAPIRESRALVQAAIALLAGAGFRVESPDQTLVPGAGGTKRRVKIKAASDTAPAGPPARAEVAPRAGSSAAKAPAKAAARGSDRSKSGSAPAAAPIPAAATPETPANSLLARLDAATPEPPAWKNTAAGGGAEPPLAPTDKPAGIPVHDTADRLARLEAEINSLTEASGAANTQRKPMGSNKSAATRTADTIAPRAPARDTDAALPTASAPPYRPAVDEGGAGDDEDDAEIVIVTPESTSGAARYGAQPGRQSPRIFREPPPGDEDDAEVEIVRPGSRPEAGGDPARAPAAPESTRARPDATSPTAPAKWRLFRGSR